MKLPVCCVLLGLIVATTGCESQPKAEPAPTASAAPRQEQAIERQVTGLATKDNVRMSFHTILLWSPAAPAAGTGAAERPDAAAVEKAYMDALRDDLPRIIADYNFQQIVAVHENQPAIAKVEARMSERLNARLSESARGAAVNRFIVRRLDLNESVQRQGIDDLQRQRLQDLWRGPVR